MSQLNATVMLIRGISLIVITILTRGNALEMVRNTFRWRNGNEAKETKS